MIEEFQALVRFALHEASTNEPIHWAVFAVVAVLAVLAVLVARWVWPNYGHFANGPHYLGRNGEEMLGCDQED